MILRNLKAEGLAHNTYFIASGEEAVVIDPRREPADLRECLDLARESGAIIRYILETHRNEDFVHGSLELEKMTGATIYHGASLPFKYGQPLRDGDRITFDKLSILTMETPGHTPESLTYVLYDQKYPDEPLATFTGDALFVNSTGRIDLPDENEKHVNAGKLYDSIHGKILPLGDHVVIYPAHGAGSVCGSGMGDRDWSTIGYEKRTNPHLQLGRDEFIEYKVGEKFVRPPYFLRMEDYNLNGPPLLESRRAPVPLGVQTFDRAMRQKGTEVVDIRLPQAFGGGHIPGSYSIWLGGMALFPGWLFDYETELLLVPYEDEDAWKADRLLCRIGFDQVYGYLAGGFEPWQNAGMPIEFTGELPVDALKPLMDTSDIRLIDVREPREWQNGIVPGALLRYVGHLKTDLPDVPRDRPVAVMCSVGHRGSLGASILQKAGYGQVYNVPGGFTAWRARDYPVKPAK
ncbi:MBL fold metallo-hydrolase [Methanocella arvoryzae]|uniref:Metallo-beta-lactamase n=1 Tax=Methanocella arvoryzae (strain DSM 22066 / NBRC 105507 / MRE50) TaxID=351160 RepID=Q0W1G4_METAR|nr:MBL fold metallo-hydrolase [Methanocella arvoryzae]CAJ37779.1 putative metallo-beta-lactamase [Methanocella arvoryzae MRE50]